MNIIFLTMSSSVSNIDTRGIYTDLFRKFRDEGNNVFIVFPHERRTGLQTVMYEQNGIQLIGVRTLNLQKASVVEKGLGQLLVEWQYRRAIKKLLSHIRFDLVLYSTPPITFPSVISFLKSRNPKASTYLLLKDIFPQNAVDLGLMSKTGLKGSLYRFFRKKEKRLYALSSYIGCMSPANVKYLLEHYPNISAEHIDVAPNSIALLPHIDKDKTRILERYHLPTDRPIFIYGGNLGRPQGIPFIIQCLEANANREDCHILVVGTGTEFPRLESWFMSSARHSSVSLIDGLPKEEYDELVRACDVGLIFLDHRFTIPNYPSRLLSYLENKMPVLCATDPNTDIGRIAEENGYGYWCESNSVEAFTVILDRMIHSDRETMGEKGYEFLKNNYLVDNTYKVIMQHFDSSK